LRQPLLSQAQSRMPYVLLHIFKIINYSHMTKCKTKYIISTVIPPPAYTTVVKTLTVTSTTKTVSKTTSSTITSTAICTPPPYPKGADPALQKVLKLPHTTISPPSSSSQKKNNHRGRSHARDIDVEYPKRVKRGIKAAFNFARNGGVLLRRGPSRLGH
jgi:hypothetical protein